MAQSLTAPNEHTKDSQLSNKDNAIFSLKTVGYVKTE